MKNFWSSSLLSAAILVLSANFCSSALTEIGEYEWRNMLEGEWMIEFYAPWCPACRQLEPTWNEFADWADDLGINVVAVDVTENAGLSGRFMITALPTIYHVKDGKFRIYRGARDKDAFISFIEEKQWRDMEEVSRWRDPSSFQMTIVSGFFKMSMVLRNVHQIITEEWGYPYWASYSAFAGMTIVFGSFLGLVLVCLLDCFHTPQPPIPADVMERIKNQKFVPKEVYLKQRKEEREREEREKKEKEEKEKEEKEKEETKEEEAKAEPSSTPSSGAVRKRKAKRAD